jgi:hypothetical protein
MLCIINCTLQAQTPQAIVSGLVTDESGNPIKACNIIILGKTKGIASNDSGQFTITVPAQKSLALVFSHTGYQPFQKNFFLSDNEKEVVTIVLYKDLNLMQPVIVQSEKERKETGLIQINPKNAMVMPSTVGGIEGIIKTLVGSNNELTSQYSVRGGNYDENIIYINDFEVFRPYLVSNGQQEGLSFINPEMVRNVNFYTGGFQSKYGDKMSSVLDIQYKKPKALHGSAYVSLLEQGLTLENNSAKHNFNYIIGLRNKNNRSLLSNQPTLGSYIPSASDLQVMISWQPIQQLQFELLQINSVSRFTFYPESVKKTSSVFSPLFTANLGLDTYFEGQEKDRYSTSMTGLTITHNLKDRLQLKWMLSRFKDDERENYDISGAYLFGDRDFDQSSSTFGEIVNPLGAGIFQQYARNSLQIEIWNAAHRGSYESGKHFFQWGNQIEKTAIIDKNNEFEYQDSAGYSLPYNSSSLSLFRYSNNSNKLYVTRYSGFLQDNIRLNFSNHQITLNAGIRYNYNNLNKEWLISPRIQANWKPGWKRDMVFKGAIGIYQQPPFYRELKKYNGSLNTAVRSQKSAQVVTGLDYQFIAFNGRPFRLSSEVYYKSMWDVIPYDVDNVKIRYQGSNNAKAHATGIEMRLFTELVKDAESWISLGLMRTRENLNDDFYFDYKNTAGEIITPQTSDQQVVDSIRRDVGFLRRPTDRLITAGLFLQDYLATNKNFKMHLNVLFGSNMPYNIPNSTKYRNALIVDPYIRIDVGFSALLLSEKNNRRSHSPFRGFDNIWASMEVFNLINKTNTISYQLIKDFANNTYAIPNSLTPRLLNFKIYTKF